MRQELRYKINEQIALPAARGSEAEGAERASGSDETEPNMAFSPSARMNDATRARPWIYNRVIMQRAQRGIGPFAVRVFFARSLADRDPRVPLPLRDAGRLLDIPGATRPVRPAENSGLR